MTERQWIDVSDLRKIIIANGILKDICAENSLIIESHELANVIRTLNKWQDEFFKQIKIED